VGFAAREREMNRLSAVIDREVRRATSEGWEAYLRELDTQSLNAPVWQSLLSHILNSETSLFRHSQQFDFLRDVVLRERPGALKCWSAGCATGEEAFTLAMVCREERRSADIWATDISRAALDAASQGRISLRRGCRDPRIASWLHHHRGGWYVDDSIRSLIRWEWANLLESDQFVSRHGPFDVIMCRNVLIYFHDEAVERVLRLFERALVPDGWLLLGHAETLLFRQTSFRMVAGGLGYTRRPPAQMQPAAKEPERLPQAHPEAAEPVEPGDDVVKQAVALEQQDRLVEAAALLREALVRDSRNILARLCLSGIYRRSGQIDAAARELNQLARQLNGRPDEEMLPGSDGLTVGALRQVIAPYAPGEQV